MMMMMISMQQLLLIWYRAAAAAPPPPPTQLRYRRQDMDGRPPAAHHNYRLRGKKRQRAEWSSRARKGRHNRQ
jgi:hypothetical protein